MPLYSVQGYYKLQEKENNYLCCCKINSRELPRFSHPTATNFSPADQRHTPAIVTLSEIPKPFSTLLTPILSSIALNCIIVGNSLQKA